MNVISLTFNTDPEGSSLTVCHLKIKYFCCWLLKSIIILQDLAQRITQSERQGVLRERVSQCITWDWFFTCRNKRSANKKKKRKSKKKSKSLKTNKKSPIQSIFYDTWKIWINLFFSHWNFRIWCKRIKYPSINPFI